MKSELHLDYDDKMHAIGATCSACGERMPKPDPELKDNAERIWADAGYPVLSPVHQSDV